MKKLALMAGAVLALSVLTAPAAFAQEASPPPADTSETPVTPAAPDAVQAIWKHQEISFYFQSFTTFYSCTGLEGKLERVMRALGVHAKVRVRSADCTSPFARMPRVTMNVVSPALASVTRSVPRSANLK